MSKDASAVTAHDEPLLIPVRAPFDLRLTVSALRRLPHAALYPLVGEEWRFVAALPSGHRLLAVRAISDGDDEVAALECAALDGALGGEDAAAAAALVARMLDVERDLTPLHTLVADDPTLAPLAQRLAGMKPPRFASLWEAFCQIVPFQQVSLSAAIATLNRFVMALGPELELRRPALLGRSDAAAHAGSLAGGAARVRVERGQGADAPRAGRAGAGGRPRQRAISLALG